MMMTDTYCKLIPRQNIEIFCIIMKTSELMDQLECSSNYSNRSTVFVIFWEETTERLQHAC